MGSSSTHCCLCGSSIQGARTAMNAMTGSGKISLESVEWRDSMQQNGYVYGKSDDLNHVYFQIPWIWSRVYRASKSPSSWG